MYCCTACFKDNQIIDIIQSYKIIGCCDFCGQKDVYVYHIGTDDTLSELFDGLLDVYTAASSLPDTFPKDKLDLLKNILYWKWDIFNVEPDCIYRLITNICSEKYLDQPELFDYPVGLLQCIDENYLRESLIIRDYDWNGFVEAIKRKSRFHTDYMNREVLDVFIKCVIKAYKPGSVFYRGRICENDKGWSIKEMGAPPADSATAGRANPEGISILYLADTVKTALNEIRAGVFDYVTIGDFELQKEIKVVNLADIDKISPFIGIDYTLHAINKEQLKMISQEIAKPLRRHDSRLDYLPTQYVSDYIKSKGFDGVEYISTMCKDGYNLAIYDEAFFQCLETTVYDVKSLVYSYDRIR